MIQKNTICFMLYYHYLNTLQSNNYNNQTTFQIMSGQLIDTQTPDRQNKNLNQDISPQFIIDQKEQQQHQVQNRDQNKNEEQNKKMENKELLKNKQPQNEFNILDQGSVILQNRRMIKALNNKPQNDGNWHNYIEHLFKYYCKSTYSTGKYVTFQKIKQKTNSLNINTFNAFCKDFNLQLSRQKIIQVFNKSTKYRSTMLKDQLIQAIFKISQQIFPIQQNQNQQIKKSKQLHKIIRFLHLHSQSAFNNKLVEISIKYRQKGTKSRQDIKKIKSQNSYKFKFQPCNGRDQLQIKQEIEHRKKNKESFRQVVKNLKQIRQRNQANKFERLNLLSIGQRKISKGGYMSPPLTNINSPTQINRRNTSNFGKNAQVFTKARSQIQSQLVTIESQVRSRRRNYTQFDTYTNSLQSSIIDNYRQTNQGQRRYPSPQSFVKKQQYKNLQRFQHLPSKNLGYMYSYQTKLKKQLKNPSYNKNYKYKVNPVIKQARQEQQISQKKQFFQKKSQQSIKFSKMNIIYQNPIQNPPLMTVTNSTIIQKHQINRSRENKYQDELDIFNNIDEQDEYLSKLNQLSIIENKNKKRMVQS